MFFFAVGLAPWFTSDGAIVPRLMTDPLPGIAAPESRGWRALWRQPFAWIAVAVLLLAALGVHGFDQAWSDAARALNTYLSLWQETLAVLRLAGRGEVVVLAVLAVGALGRRRVAGRMLLALLVTAVVVTTLKHAVGRIRPNGQDLSFPGGDVATAAALILPLLTTAGFRAWGAIAAVLTIGVMASRMLLGYHFPSDVLAGAAAGIASAAIADALRWPRIFARLLALPAWAYGVGAALMAGVCAVLLFPDGGGQDLRRFVWLAAPLLVFAVIASRLRARAWRTGTALPAWLEERPWWPLLLIAGLFLLITTRSTLWDRDEPRFAKSSVEMAYSTHGAAWLVPHVNGDERLHKPILIYWLQALPVRALGVTELAVRLPAVLAALIACLTVWWLARRLFGPGHGLPAALILATSPLLLVCGTAATTDAVLLVCISGAVAVFVAASIPDRNGRALKASTATVAMGVLVGLAQLVKGPIGLAVPLLTVLATWIILIREPGAVLRARSTWWGLLALAVLIALGWWFRGALGHGVLAWSASRAWWLMPVSLLFIAAALAERPALRFGPRHLLAVTLFSLAMFLAWAIPANNATDGRFLSEGLGKHVVNRSAVASEGHSGPLWFYVPVLIGAFIPWTFLLPAIGAALLRGFGKIGGSGFGAQPRALLLGWLLPIFVLMSVIATKLPHYILPVFPALALAAVGLLPQAHIRARGWFRFGKGATVALLTLLGVVVVIAIWPATTWLHLDGVATPVAGVGLLLLTVAWWLYRGVRSDRPGLTVPLLAAGMLSLQVALGAFALPAIETYKPAALIAHAVNAVVPLTTPVFTSGYQEPSLDFYLARTPVQRLDLSQLATWKHAPGPAVLIVSREEGDKHHADFHGLTLIGQRAGFNYSNGKWVELSAYGRQLP